MSPKPAFIVRLTAGPMDSAMLSVPFDSKWLWVRYAGPVTTDTKFAAWPHDDPPTRRPPLSGTLICYRLRRTGATGTKAEFEWDPAHSDPLPEPQV